MASASLDAGANMINDVSSLGDSGMAEVIVEYGCPVCLMHMKGIPENMQKNPQYYDVVSEVRKSLANSTSKLNLLGVDNSRIIVDPGIGFGKLLEHNMAILNALTEFSEIGYPVMIGTSRKRSLQEICGTGTPSQLEGATCATTALGVQSGVTIFRVHDVKANRQAADVAWAVLNHKFGK